MIIGDAFKGLLSVRHPGCINIPFPDPFNDDIQKTGFIIHKQHFHPVFTFFPDYLRAKL